ncbi:MAG: hypothetical protein A2W25_05645 [candidate division Zixibacteria bacterium RBG_16_53_22]|nr:MAG: hypothetical protein A2W25_05645 [candidate division Zixibacteria bacterium RBG_16_53_22]
MRRAVIISILIAACDMAFASGFDDAVMERFNYPSLATNGLSFEPSRLCRPGFGAGFLHTNPYRIGSLSWDFAAARYGRRGLGLYGSFRSYRLDDIYNDVTIEAGVASHIYKGIYSSVSVARQREDFRGNDDFVRLTCDFRVSYDGGDFIAQAGLEGVVIRNPYDISGGERSAPTFRAGYFATEDIMLSTGYRRDQFGRGRWTFGQETAIIPGVRLRLGFMNNPNTLEWGLDLSCKSLTLMFDYKAVNKLSDTVMLGLAMGK